MEAVPKIEGHAAFYTHLRNGRVDRAQIIGMENDRFVEKILYGRKYYEAPIITSRICGICPTIHSTTSIQAMEKACGITPSYQTKTLRKLMLAGQMIQSHSLHLYLLVLPDFVGASSSFELQKSHPELFGNAVLLKQYADMLLDTIGGRAVHPISDVPGGFKSFPSKEKLNKLFEMSKKALEIALSTVLLFAKFEYPSQKIEIIYSALSSDNEYAIYEGNIKTSAGNNFAPEKYHNYIYEELKPYTRAKFGTLRGREMMVGAMARMNLNRDKMGKEIEELINKLNLDAKILASSHVIPAIRLGSHQPRPKTGIQVIDRGVKPKDDNFLFNNPFNNIIAQAIENYYFVLESEKFIKYFLDYGIDKKDPVKPPKEFGNGVGACEAPRGTLYHYYKLDKNGYIEKCDIITPTVQNLPALELCMKNLGPLIKDLPKEEEIKTIEMLIRAFDPCITCATH